MHITRDCEQGSHDATPKIPRIALKIPTSVVVQHKIGQPMINVKNRAKYDLPNTLK